MASHHVFRYNAWETSVTLSAGPGNTNIPLLTSNDDPDYEVGGDFATSCQCEEGAIIKDINLRLNISGGANDTYEWMLIKSPNALLDASLPATVFSNDPVANTQLLRKNCLAYGAGVIPADNQERNVRVFVRNSALRRIGQMHEDDNLRIRFRNHDAATAMTLRGYGRILVAEN